MKTWYSHKFKYSAVRYEIGLCILTGCIVWINGPFPAGLYSDITIFWQNLKGALGKNERVVADDGYIGEAPEYVKCLAKTFQSNTKMFQNVRARHETVNNRFKFFCSMKSIWRHDVSLHSKCFRAIAVLTQLAIEKGEIL